MITYKPNVPMSDVRPDVSYQSSVMDGFSFTHIGSSDHGDIIALDRDITILLDSTKVQQPVFQQVISEMLSQVRTSMSSVFDGYSDDQLLTAIKSRYLQAPCEIQAWSDWLQNNLQSIYDSLPKPEPVIDPVSNPEPPSNA